MTEWGCVVIQKNQQLGRVLASIFATV